MLQPQHVSRVARAVLAVLVLAGPSALGQPRFVEVGADAGLALSGPVGGGVSWTDFDGDGCLDVAVSRSSETVLLRAACTGTPRFTRLGPSQFPRASIDAGRSVVWGDVDNDGHVDLLENEWSAIHVYFGRGAVDGGAHALAPPVELRAPSLNAEGLGLADVDADGWLDVIAQTNGAVLFRNPADGGLPVLALDSGLPSSPDNGDFLAVGDYDVDGDVDLVVRLVSVDPVWTNVDGRFRANPSLPERSSEAEKGSVLLCDFDDDGDFDVFWSASAAVAPNRIWLQGPAGAFSVTGEPPSVARDVRAAACGDLDNDGDLDLLLVRDGPDSVWINESTAGRLSFRADNQGLLGAPSGASAALVDFDRDGDLDVYLNQDSSNELWQNTTEGGSYLVVRALRQFGAGRVRDELGATVQLEDCDGGRRTGVREVNGGEGRGGQGSTLVHFGLPSGPDVAYVVVVRFVGGSVVRRAVVPSSLGAYQLLTVVRGEPDELAACSSLRDGGHGDGGNSREPLRLAVGCGCSSSSAASLGLLAALAMPSALALRRRPRRQRQSRQGQATARCSSFE